MNLPNKLTILRFILVPIFVIFIMLPETILAEPISRCIAAGIFLITALTDTLDGKIARKYNLVTNFGKFMDPLADKFMIFSALIAIVARYDNSRYVIAWVTIIVMLRELAITSLRLIAADSVVIAASWLGKIKTVVQCVSIVVVLLEPVILGNFSFFAKFAPLSLISMACLAFFTVYSGVDYVVKYKDFLKETK